MLFIYKKYFFIIDSCVDNINKKCVIGIITNNNCLICNGGVTC